MNRATCWSVTINNPTAADEEAINLARQKGWKVEGQLEKGASGTPHFQLMVRTPQVRFAAVRKQFPGAHVEPARNPAALLRYVGKEVTREGDLPTPQTAYPSLSKFWELLAAELDERSCIDWDYLVNPTDERPSSIWWREAPAAYRRDPLKALDDITASLIERGFHVESMAVNPQVRSAWRLFHAAILVRTFADKDRQTDSLVQNDAEEIAVVNIPYADDDSRTQAARGILGQVNGDQAQVDPTPPRSCGGSD